MRDDVDASTPGFVSYLHTDNRDGQAVIVLGKNEVVLQRPRASLRVCPLSAGCTVTDGGTGFLESHPTGLRTLALASEDAVMIFPEAQE